MEMGEVLATTLGVVVIALVLWDIFLAVLHIDRDGILAPRLHKLVWTCAVFLSRRLPWMRRELLALAGPAMMAFAFVVWIGLFILGFALVVWPHLNESFRSEDEMRTLTFIDAVYYSGITGTVLGHGDVTPLSSPMKVVAFVEAGLGFALLTGIVAYLLNVVSGVVDRNVLAIRLQNEVQQAGSGVASLIRHLKSEQLSDVWLRLENLSRSVQDIQEKMHQFPILDLYYRSVDPRRDPEPMLQILTETAIASQLLAQQAAARRLRPVSEDLSRGTTQLMQIMANQFMSSEAREKIAHGQPESEDQARVEEIQAILKQGVNDYFTGDTGADVRSVVRLAFRARVFLAELDRLTGWRIDHPRRPLSRSAD